jgi:hypothetical protein
MSPPGDVLPDCLKDEEWKMLSWQAVLDVMTARLEVAPNGQPACSERMNSCAY